MRQETKWSEYISSDNKKLWSTALKLELRNYLQLSCQHIMNTTVCVEVETVKTVGTSQIVEEIKTFKH